MGKIKLPQKLKNLSLKKLTQKMKNISLKKLVQKVKTMSKKQKILLFSVIVLILAAIVAVVILIVHHVSGDEMGTYRSIQIYQLEGTATIEREEIGEIEAAENFYLESGDYVSVDEDSYMRLQLDEDKYVLVEPNTIFSIVAEGTEDTSETSIDLEEGAITNEIQNTLNEDSYYEITTPNSVMAVRGTVFRVEVSMDDEGEIYTKVDTFEGVVETYLILPDGTAEEELVLVEGGKEVTIHMNEETTEYVSEPQDIDYEEFPYAVLQFLGEVVENGTMLEGVTQEELEDMIAEKAEEEEYEYGDYVQEDDYSEYEDESEEIEEAEETEQENGATKKKSENNKDDEENEDDEDEEDDTTKNDDAKKPTTTSQETYTVTFMYNGAVFGTQTVKKGQKATSLKLAPAESGSWDFDFSKTISADTTINWKE